MKAKDEAEDKAEDKAENKAKDVDIGELFSQGLLKAFFFFMAFLPAIFNKNDNAKNKDIVAAGSGIKE